MNETFILSANDGLLKCDSATRLPIWVREMADQVLKRAGIESAQVEDRIWGWDGPWNSLVSLLAEHHDVSETLPGIHLWQEKEAGLQAVLYASLGIQSGEYDLLLAGGGRKVSEPLREGIWEKYEAAVLVLASPALVGRQNLLPSGILTTKIISGLSMTMNEKMADAARLVIQKARIEPEQLDLICQISPGLETHPDFLRQLEEATGLDEQLEGKMMGFTYSNSLIGLVEVFNRLGEDHKQRALLLGRMGQRTALAILLERL